MFKRNNIKVEFYEKSNESLYKSKTSENQVMIQPTKQYQEESYNKSPVQFYMPKTLNQLSTNDLNQSHEEISIIQSHKEQLLPEHIQLSNQEPVSQLHITPYNNPNDLKLYQSLELNNRGANSFNLARLSRNNLKKNKISESFGGVFNSNKKSQVQKRFQIKSINRQKLDEIIQQCNQKLVRQGRNYNGLQLLKGMETVNEDQSKLQQALKKYFQNQQIQTTENSVIQKIEDILEQNEFAAYSDQQNLLSRDAYTQNAANNFTSHTKLLYRRSKYKMTILSNKESPNHLHNESESSKTVSTANSSMVNSIGALDEAQIKRILKRVWKVILVGDLDRLKKLHYKLIGGGQELSNAKINKFGWTPLHAACYFGKLEIVKYLVEQDKADPNETNPNGWHSLIFAVMGGHGSQIVDYLIHNTITNALIKDDKGNSALVYAKSICPGSQAEIILERANTLCEAQ
eukprot:403359924